MVATLNPVVLWAQRSDANEPEKNVIFLTIQLADAKNTKIDLTSTELEFTSDTSDSDAHYHLKIEFFDEIDTENSKQNDSGSKIYLVLRKKKAQEEYWPRLTKDKLKLHYIKTDFDKWVDEDEQDEQPEGDDDMAGMANMMGGGAGGMPGMPGMGGMGGMPGMGGAGGPGGAGGFDIASLMQQMGGAGGAGGPGGDFDISQLASQLGQAGGAGLDDGEDGEGEEEEASAPIEEVK